MNRELTTAILGMGLYAVTAEASASKWTNFFGKPGRPENSPSEVKTYVLSTLKASLCDASFSQVLSGKGTDDARQKTQANIDALRKKAEKILGALKVYSPNDLPCSSASLDLATL
jgi:hypothetical protein